MSKHLNIILCLLFIMSTSTVLAGYGNKIKKQVTVAPSDVFEKCLKMEADQRLKYSFKSSKPLKFNLHYHLVEKTVFHVKEETSSRSEIFQPIKDQNVYCMEWRNPHSDDAELNYEYIAE